MSAAHISTSGHFHIVGAGERSAYIILGSLVWLYAACRAAWVPWVHDESTSLFWYLERGQFLPYQALWDAGNHFLSSAIGVFGHKLWGLSLFGSRVGSLLAFPVYAWAAWHLGARVQHRTVRWTLWSALLLCPFVLDFFSLFRGYALGLAFVLAALEVGLRYQVDARDRSLFLLLLFLSLAAFSTLSLVPLWVAVVALLGIVILKRWRSASSFPMRTVAIWSAMGVVPVLIGLLLSWEMRRRGLLYHGSLDGIGAVTLVSLCRFVVGTTALPALAAVSLLLLFGSVWALRQRALLSPVVWIALLLWADVVMRVGMALLLGVNYPEDRAALHLVPLAILLVAFAADEAQQVRPGLYRMALPLLFLPIRSIWTANLDHTILWPEQSVPTRFLQHIATMQQKAHRPLIIGAYNQLNVALPYAARINGLTLNLPEVDAFPEGPHDVRIVDDRYLEEALPGHRVVDRAPGPGLSLLVPERSLRTAIFGRLPFAPGTTSDPEVLVWRDDSLAATQDVILQLRCGIWATTDFLDTDLVIRVEGKEGRLFDRTHHLPVIRARWSGEELHVALLLPALPDAEVRSLFFRNRGGDAITFIPGEIKLHRTNVTPSH